MVQLAGMVFAEFWPFLPKEWLRSSLTSMPTQPIVADVPSGEQLARRGTGHSMFSITANPLIWETAHAKSGTDSHVRFPAAVSVDRQIGTDAAAWKAQWPCCGPPRPRTRNRSWPAAASRWRSTNCRSRAWAVPPECRPCSFCSILPRVTQRPESRLREICMTGSEGGGPQTNAAFARRFPAGHAVTIATAGRSVPRHRRRR